MGSFGPLAWNTDHIPSEKLGSAITFRDLQSTNQDLKQSALCYMFDAYSGGGGGTIAALLAGVHVVAGAEISQPEIQVFEQITGSVSLGSVLGEQQNDFDEHMNNTNIM